MAVEYSAFGTAGEEVSDLEGESGDGLSGGLRLIQLWATPKAHRWRAFAACRGYPTSWFIGNENPPARALELCGECSVREACREAAPDGDEITVLYGGEVIKGTPRSGLGGRPRQYNCGTEQAKRRHLRRDELCFECYPGKGRHRP